MKAGEAEAAVVERELIVSTPELGLEFQVGLTLGVVSSGAALVLYVPRLYCMSHSTTAEEENGTPWRGSYTDDTLKLPFDSSYRLA